MICDYHYCSIHFQQPRHQTTVPSKRSADVEGSGRQPGCASQSATPIASSAGTPSRNRVASRSRYGSLPKMSCSSVSCPTVIVAMCCARFCLSTGIEPPYPIRSGQGQCSTHTPNRQYCAARKIGCFGYCTRCVGVL